MPISTGRSSAIPAKGGRFAVTRSSRAARSASRVPAKACAVRICRLFAAGRPLDQLSRGEGDRTAGQRQRHPFGDRRIGGSAIEQADRPEIKLRAHARALARSKPLSENENARRERRASCECKAGISALGKRKCPARRPGIRQCDASRPQVCGWGSMPPVSGSGSGGRLPRPAVGTAEADPGRG